MNKYAYSGPVMMFDTCIQSKWQGETYAVSEEKAKSNLTYQYKKRNNLSSGAKITLPEKVILLPHKEYA